jgi:uncharacterized protein
LSTTTATVTHLFVYPLKSARGIAKSRVHLSASGFQWDRQWMVVNAVGVFLSQRTHPQLARVIPSITRRALVLRAPELPPLRVPFTAAGERIAVRVHEARCVGVDQGEAAAAWVSRALGEPLRLVRVPQDNARIADPAFAGEVPAPMGFADGYPILVCNEASLADLNERMPKAIPMARFRPNIVLKGLPAWSEDEIDTLTVGEVTLRLVKPCTRCTVPSVDQRLGVFSTDPGPVLRTFRFDRALRGITFGENAVIASGLSGEILRGARARVGFETRTAGLA